MVACAFRTTAGAAAFTPMSLTARVDEFFRPGGRLSRAHAGYEPRDAQRAMALDVLEALSAGEHLVVEAGTGIGKTLAYLVPAIMLGRRVVVSTGTRALQDQLALKDVPFLQEECGLSFSAAVLKGRDNYLCRHRFGVFAQSPVFATRAEAATWPALADWSEETATGDLAELPDVPENPSFWPLVNARDATCLGTRCPRHEDCHLQEVRRAARAADVIIVNHHLYLADAVLRAGQFGELLPECDRVVFDEAHRLEPAATSFFGRTVSSRRLTELAVDVVQELDRSGLDVAAVRARADELSAVAGRLARAWGPPGGRRLVPARLPAQREETLAEAAAAVRGLSSSLEAVPQAAELEPFRRRGGEILADLALLSERSDPAWVHWFEARGRHVTITATPVDVAALLRQHVFGPLQASVLCSATLSVGKSMGHVRGRLGLVAGEAGGADGPGADGAEEDRPLRPVREAFHDSPFDPAIQGLLYLPRGLPDPRDASFVAAGAEEARRLVEASRGRAFLLFTSFQNLHATHEILRDALPGAVHVQGEAPKHELLRRFVDQPASVLFATASFWEGVDVPGEALSLVVIDRLPFAVPTDPIVAARARLVEESGGNAFRQLALPEAVLALKQGAGRLLRARSDRGVVAVLDPRLTRAAYGRAFLADLPRFRRTRRIEDVRRFFGADASS